jgi:hypothetical protein
MGKSMELVMSNKPRTVWDRDNLESFAAELKLELADMTSEELTELEQHIHSRLAGRVREFHLEVHKEGLVLRGRALTYYAKQLAQHAVMEISEVPIWANEIEVS